jgi:hypothetical protein
MAKLYEGPAVFSFPDGDTVDAVVDLTRGDDPALVTWTGTAESADKGSLWNGGQRACTVRIGDAESSYRIGECMVTEVEPVDHGDRVVIKGSGELSTVDPPV